MEGEGGVGAVMPRLSRYGMPVDVRGRTAMDSFLYLHHPNQREKRARRLAGKVMVGDHVTVLIESRGRASVEQGMYPAIVAVVDERTEMFLVDMLGDLKPLSRDEWYSKIYFRREWDRGFTDMSNVKNPKTRALYEFLEDGGVSHVRCAPGS